MEDPGGEMIRPSIVGQAQCGDVHMPTLDLLASPGTDGMTAIEAQEIEPYGVDVGFAQCGSGQADQPVQKG